MKRGLVSALLLGTMVLLLLVATEEIAAQVVIRDSVVIDPRRNEYDLGLEEAQLDCQAAGGGLLRPRLNAGLLTFTVLHVENRPEWHFGPLWISNTNSPYATDTLTFVTGLIEAGTIVTREITKTGRWTFWVLIGPPHLPDTGPCPEVAYDGNLPYYFNFGHCFWQEDGSVRVLLDINCRLVPFPVDHFLVVPIRKTILPGEYSVLRVDPVDKYDNLVIRAASDTTFINLSIDQASTQYGGLSLVSPSQNPPLLYESLTDVHVSKAVFFISNGVIPDLPKNIHINATKTNDPSVTGNATMTIRGKLDHFEVTIQPDTIEYLQTATVMAQAKDINGNNIEIANSLPLDLTFEENETLLGHFIALDGSQATTLSGISYGDVQSGHVKFIANIENSIPVEHQQATIRVKCSDYAEVGGSGVVVVTKTVLDHFAVTVSPDTIGHDSTATVAVQAKDENHNDVVISDGTPLDFALDARGELLGNFIAPNGAHAKSLTAVLYGDARAGKVRYIANGAKPDSTQGVLITVSKSDEVSKKGTGRVVVKGSVKIRIDFADRELAPLDDSDNKGNPNYNKEGPDKRKKIVDFSKVKKTTVTVKITDAQDVPVPDYSFTISALTRQESGGHDHPSSRPTGKFVTAADDTLASVQGVTDDDGKASYTYLSSGIGGVDSIFVQGKTDKDTASTVIVLRMGGLQLLADGEHYNLIGAYGEDGVTSRHTVNHYGTSDLISKLQALADSVYADSSFVLRINDMSLVNGGPFDTGNNWNTPHQNHREGVSADIDDVNANGKIIGSKYLERWLSKPSFKGKINDEGNHFHVTFR